MANIFFRSIKLKNFMSYEEAEVKLSRSGYVVVKGTNNNPDDSAKSNGSGKSSLFTAICWALTGETISGAKNVNNIYTGGTTEVELSFNYDDREFVVNRTKNPSNLHLYVDGEDKSGKGIRDTEKILEEYIPQITYRLLSSVIILGQGLPQRFTNNTPAGRKEVLEQLSNSDFMIEDIKEKLTARKELINNSLSSCKSERDLDNGVLISTNKEIDSLVEELSSMDDNLIREAIDNLNEDIEELEFKKEGLSVQYEEYENLFIKSSDEYDEFLASIEKRREEIELEEYDDTELNALAVDIALAEKDYKTKSSIVDICPTCGQKIPEVNKPSEEDLQAMLQDIASKKEKQLKMRNDKCALNAKNIEKLDAFKTENDAKLKELKEIKEQHRSEFNKIDGDLIDINYSLNQRSAELTIQENKLAEFNSTVESLSSKIDSKKRDVVNLTSKIENLNSSILDLESRLDVNSKMFTLIKRDFRGYLLTNVVDYIQSRAKIYCNDIFGTNAIEFKIDGNNIVINYDGKEYEILSGGEKQKIDVIIQFSIRDMLCKFLDFSSNILVLDEITDALDETGAHKVFDMISKRLSDVEAVYIISHHLLDFDIPEDSEIVIEKGCDKISRVI